MKFKTYLVLCHFLCRVYSKSEKIFCLGLVPMKQFCFKIIEISVSLHETLRYRKLIEVRGGL